MGKSTINGHSYVSLPEGNPLWTCLTIIQIGLLPMSLIDIVHDNAQQRQTVTDETRFTMRTYPMYQNIEDVY